MARAPKTPTPDTPRPNYRVLSPLQHDGVAYAVGDIVELADDQAEPLLGHTVSLEPAAEPAPDTQT